MGVVVQTHVFLTSEIAGGQWSTSRPGSSNPGEGAPDTHWIGGWVDPRAGLDNEKAKFLTLPDSNSDSSVIQPVTSPYTHYTIPDFSIRQCSSPKLSRRFRETCHQHLYCRKVRQIRNHHEVGHRQRRVIFFIGIQGVISQKRDPLLSSDH
jgi:hypothetical protein